MTSPTRSDRDTQAKDQERASSTFLQRVQPGVWATGAIALVAAVLILAALWFLARPLTLLFAGITIAQAFAPLVSWLEQRMSRMLAILLVYLVTILILIAIGLIIVPRLVEQGELLVDEIPNIFEDVEQQLIDWGIVEDGQILDELRSQLASFSQLLVSIPMNIISAVLDVFLVIVISIYWLIAMPSLWKFTLSLFREERRDDVAGVVTEVGSAMGGFVRGEAISTTVIGVISYIVLSIIDVRFALALGIISGILEIIPTIGPFIGGVLSASVALLDSPTKALMVVIAWIGIQGFESYLLTPTVMKTQAQSPPLLTILAVFAGGYVGGLLGALVAIPLAGAGRVLVIRVIAPAIRLWTGAAESRRVA